MKRIALLAFASAGFLVSGPVLGQDDDEPETYTYATYLYCNTDREDTVDANWAEAAPVMDKLVKDGTLKSWGYLAHHTGGQWRRVRYHQSDSLQGAFDGLDAMNKALDEAFPDDGSDDDSSGACPRHDDYIWQVQSSSGGEGRAEVGFSVYYVCDITREGRADEIFEERMAPGFNKMVEDGAIASWGWSSHVIGGQYRRLQTMTAANLAALLEARTASIEMMYPEDSAAAQEFAEICGPHTDYIWEVRHETP